MTPTQFEAAKEVLMHLKSLSNGLPSDATFDAADRAKLNAIIQLQDDLVKSET